MATSQMTSDPRSAVRGAWAAVAEAWGEHADDLDGRNAAISQRLLELAALHEGESVLELAGGPGGVGLAAAAQVGDSGHVVISDVVPAMVEVAQRRVNARGLANVTTKVLDLEDIADPDASYDAVLCREGLMFAVDPAHAAAEIHRVLRPSGRFAVAVWAQKSANPWLAVLLDAIHEVTGIVVPPPGIPGPFALADDERLQRLFAEAGFTGLTLDTVPAPVRAPSFDAWWERTRRVAGPVIAVLNRVDDETKQRIRDAVRAGVSIYQNADGSLHLPGLSLVLGGSRS